MSTYMLSDEDYQKLGDWMFQQATHRNNPYFHKVACFLDLKCKIQSMLDFEEIQYKVTFKISNFYKLNQLALTTRYHDPYPKEYFIWSPKQTRSSIEEIINILRNLIYQTMEDFVIETDSFKELNKFTSDLGLEVLYRIYDEKK